MYFIWPCSRGFYLFFISRPQQYCPSITNILNFTVPSENWLNNKYFLEKKKKEIKISSRWTFYPQNISLDRFVLLFVKKNLVDCAVPNVHGKQTFQSSSFYVCSPFIKKNCTPNCPKVWVDKPVSTFSPMTA